MQLLPWLASAIILGLISLFAARRINKYLRGDPEVIALIGRTDTGKSTFLACLEDGKLPDSAPPSTLKGRKSEPIVVESKTFHLFDTSGSELEQWVKAVHGARSVFYFFDARLVAKDHVGTLNWIMADAAHIKDTLPRARFRRFTVVGTHADLFADRRQDEEKVRNHRVIEELRASTATSDKDVVIGSLVTNKDALRLVDAVVSIQSSRA